MAYYARNNIPNYQNITEITSGHLPTDINTSLAQNWYSAFNNCRNLTSLPDPFYDTSNATNMSWMFWSCNLTSVPNFDTSNVTDMSLMFSRCTSLTTIPIFDTSNVTSMGYMFEGCRDLTTVPNFDTSNVTNMNSMFQYCDNLTTIPNFDTSNVTDMSWMFDTCGNLTTVPNFDTSKVTTMSSMFDDCSNLTTVPNFNTINVTNMSEMFSSCYNLTTIPIFDTSKVTNMYSMFQFCYNIKGDLYIESNNVTNARDMFWNCSNYTKNIYCHANTTTYTTIYRAMGNNTYNSNWNAHLKTFGSEPIPLLKIADAFDENGKQDTVNYVFRTPLPNIHLYVHYNNKYQTYISYIANVTPYQDLNISVQFNVTSPNVSGSGLELPSPLGLKIINRDTNEVIYDSFNPNKPTSFAAFNVNYYLGI